MVPLSELLVSLLATSKLEGALDPQLAVDSERYNRPDEALSDGPQSLYPDQFDELMKQVRQIAAVVGRTVPAIGVREAAAVK